jgi:CHC2 zinc finger
METTREWVDFKAVKEAVTMEMVLDHYRITGLKKVRDELRGKCPIHHGADNKHFTVNLSKNVFKCFFKNCGAHGNVLDFVAAKEGCSVRDAALKLKDWFQVGETESQPPTQNQENESTPAVKRGIYRDTSDMTDLYELIIPLALSDDLEPVVVYRELFGEYRYFVASAENFDQSLEPTFILVKGL